MPDPKDGQVSQDHEAIERLSDEIEKLKNVLYWQSLQNTSHKLTEPQKPQPPSESA